MNIIIGGTGSLRYMAPEVMRNEPYNETVDIYSFGIIFWRILTGLVPYSGINNFDSFRDIVSEKCIRPSLVYKDTRLHLPIEIQDILSLCWADDYKHRLSACDILIKLSNIQTKYKYNNVMVFC